MTEKRQLEGIEREVTEKNLAKDKLDLEYLSNVAIVKKELAVKLAPLEYKYQLEQLQKELKQLKQTKEVLEKSIAITEDQLQNGVDKKENKEASEELEE